MSETPRLPRFFVDPPLTVGPLALSGNEAHHLMHVLRLESGSRVSLFDGTGQESSAVVISVNRHAVILEAESPVASTRDCAISLTVAVSLPKADRQKFLIEKLTELGVSTLVPLVTRRGVAQPTLSAIERLRKGVIAASKQCGRNTLMNIGEAARPTELIGNFADSPARFFAHPGPENRKLRIAPETTEAIVAIGPEGGFDESEVALFTAHGWVSASLGHTILRVETAAIAVATLICIGQID